MIKTSPYIDRKEIAALLNCQITERSICNHEAEWGLDKVRVKFKARPVLYDREKAMEILKKLGILSEN